MFTRKVTIALQPGQNVFAQVFASLPSINMLNFQACVVQDTRNWKSVFAKSFTCIILTEESIINFLYNKLYRPRKMKACQLKQRRLCLLARGIHNLASHLFKNMKVIPPSNQIWKLILCCEIQQHRNQRRSSLKVPLASS